MNTLSDPGRRRLIVAFGAASLAAVLAGCLICALSGVPAAIWARNLVAWAAGAIIACGILLAPARSASTTALLLAPLLIAAALLGPDQSGIHRWLALGPVLFNAAMISVPPAVVALALLGRDHRWPWVVAGAALIALIAQPDASQAAALAVAMVVIALSSAWPPVPRWGVAISTALLAAMAAFRPDPLLPVPEVEGVVGLAWSLSPLLAAAAVLLLAAASLVPAYSLRGAATVPRNAAFALTACLAAGALAPLLGAFPVPWVGMGMSPILGAWLGVGLLAASAKMAA